MESRCKYISEFSENYKNKHGIYPALHVSSQPILMENMKIKNFLS